MMMDLDTRTAMLRNLAFNNYTLDVINEDTPAFEAVYTAVADETRRAAEKSVRTPLRPRTPERVRAEELLRPDDADFIENAYIRIFGRDADPVGGINYLMKLRSGECSKEDIILFMCLSGEGQERRVTVDGIRMKRPRMDLLTGCSDREFVERAYNWLLGRKADAQGMKMYLDMLKRGASRRSIVEALAGSPERADLRDDELLAGEEPAPVDYADLTRYDDAMFVANAFWKLLGRAPEPRDAGNWLMELRTGAMTKDEILFSLRMSAEGCRKGVIITNANPERMDIDRLMALDDTAFVSATYMWVLGRKPDEAGLRHNVKLLKDGMKKSDWLHAIADSEEARFRAPAAYLIRRLKGEPEQLRALAPAGFDSAAERRRAEEDMQFALICLEMHLKLDAMSDRLRGEFDNIKANSAAASIAAAVARREAAVAREIAADALNRLAEARMRLAELEEQQSRSAAKPKGNGK